MQLLKERIRTDGRVLKGNILKVDSFLNHQLDPVMMQAIGREFADHFRDAGVTKILTVEASGIAVALMTALELNVPVLFAKKIRAKTQNDDVYTAEVTSYTRNETRPISVSARYLTPQDRVLILDDFLAEGQATQGMLSIVRQSGAQLAGVGIVVEKGFQQGGRRLREQGVPLHSLVIIDELSESGIRFRGDDSRS